MRGKGRRLPAGRPRVMGHRLRSPGRPWSVRRRPLLPRLDSSHHEYALGSLRMRGCTEGKPSDNPLNVIIVLIIIITSIIIIIIIIISLFCIGYRFTVMKNHVSIHYAIFFVFLFRVRKIIKL